MNERPSNMTPLSIWRLGVWISPLMRPGAWTSIDRLALMFPSTVPWTMISPTSTSASTIAPSPMTSTSSENTSPLNRPSMRTVPSNVSLPSKLAPRPSSVVISPSACFAAVAAMVRAPYQIVIACVFPLAFACAHPGRIDNPSCRPTAAADDRSAIAYLTDHDLVVIAADSTRTVLPFDSHSCLAGHADRLYVAPGGGRSIGVWGEQANIASDLFSHAG